MNIGKQLRRAAAVGMLGLAAAGAASAQYITHRVAAGDIVFMGGPVSLLPLTNMFFNAAGQPFVVTFSADCAVNAPNFVDYTSVELFVWDAGGAVIAQILPPTGGPFDEFCTSNGTAGFDGRGRHSVTAVGGIGLAAGFYQVGVRAGVSAAGVSASYGNRALVVSR